MNLTYDVITKDFDDVSIRLVYEAMIDRNISSGNVDGLTLEEIKNEILPGKEVHRILLDDKVIGIYNPGIVHQSCYYEWSLKKGVGYARIGFVIIDKPYRNNGYATKALLDHSSNYENYAECCHEDNVESNAMLSKVLKFHKRAYISYRRSYYNIYVKQNC